MAEPARRGRLSGLTIGRSAPTGVHDGTENPTLIEAPELAVIGEDEPGAGGTVLLLQKRAHDASRNICGKCRFSSVCSAQLRDLLLELNQVVLPRVRPLPPT